MKKLLLSTVALMGLTVAAGAADLPRRAMAPVAPILSVPVFTWTGFYVGVHAGYAFGDSDIRTTGVLQGNINNVNALARPPSLSVDKEGFIGGAQIGFNYQFGMFVAGIEADLSYTDLSETQTYASPTTFGAALAGTRSTLSQDLEYLGTVRARLGVSFDRALVYVTGGLAYGDVSYRADFFTSGGALQFAGRKSDVEVGYTIGAGVEYAFTNNLTLKAEYLYYDLGSRNVQVDSIPGVGTGAYVSRFETDGHIARVGLNYKF
ncbi:outer membrane protein [Salinarimonas soli]|uniref:Porin family protein n=1 Tax=Salinarimonas soli TaxID=1638099 RepID=A0A5B2V7G1_9HYPH|nr:outer membrane protein [Salinarimonas soli]KAA2234746.1 porin family protein [Salinarimonas soli]